MSGSDAIGVVCRAADRIFGRKRADLVADGMEGLSARYTSFPQIAGQTIEVYLLDMFQHGPAIAGGDVADRLADRETAGTRLFADPKREIAAIIFDFLGRKPLRQRRERVDSQQFMIPQIMVQDMWLLGIGAGKGKV